MNKFYLQSKVRSTGTAYLFYFFLFGTHYAYLNKWGWQLLFWFTLGGFGLWAFFDLFTMNGKVNRYNSLLFQQIEDIEKKGARSRTCPKSFHDCHGKREWITITTLKQ